MRKYMVDLYDILIPLAEAYESKSKMSADEYVNSVTAVYDEQNSLSPTMQLNKESKELLKILIENPIALHDIQTNTLGRDIINMAVMDSSKMEEFKELVQLLNKGELKVKIPDRLKN